MASTKRERPELDESEAKKPKLVTADRSESTAKQRVALNPADCNLDFNVEDDGLQGSALHEQGFAYCWSGARANVGITAGKYCFSCKIISAQPVVMDDTPLDQQHVCRLGISRGDDTVGNLGETEHSFGFGGTGKFSSARKFINYGEPFGDGDTIVCAVDLESKPLASIGFSKNGKWLGTAKQFDAGSKGLEVVDSPLRMLQWESALFPHVLLKNVVVQMQFSVEEGLIPLEGYKPWASALEDGNAIIGPTFLDSRDCEVIMMVGLPASGKTTWAEKWVKEHPEKRYVLLGTNLALEQMKVPGLLRKNNYGERFDLLMDRATGIFNMLLSRASKTPRNYILDQTNVYKSARKRKLRPFANFRKIAVVTFPNPEELKFRGEKRFQEMGKEVPAEAVNEMLANYVLPTTKNMRGSDEFFDEVRFPELNREEAQRHLDEMKRALSSSSNVNSNSNFSPYSRESSVNINTNYSPYSRETSVKSYTSSYLPNQPFTSVPMHTSHSPLPPSHSPLPPSNYNYHRPEQVSPPYQGSGSYSGMYQNDQYPLVPRDASAPLRSYYNYASGTDPCRSYGIGPSSENRSFISGGGPSNMVEPYSSYNYESASAYTSQAQPARRLSLYNTPDDSVRHPGVTRPGMQSPPREPAFWSSPSPTTYGLPYGTPPPRPNTNLPSDPHHSVPPYPRYC